MPNNTIQMSWPELMRSILLKSYDASLYEAFPEQKRCGVIAISKDEAPYLAEFIHHYIYFGFSQIVILFNRTTDSSELIIKRIMGAYPQVSILNIDIVDELDISHSMQSIGLACGIRALRRTGLSDYALMCDIDEFWFPVDFETSIEQYLSALPPFDQVSFNWVAQMTREKKFAQPFETNYGFPARDHKSIVRLSSPIMAVGAHGCDYHIHYKPTSTWIDASGVNQQISVPLFGSEASPSPAATQVPSETKTLLIDQSPDIPKWWHCLLHQNAYVLHRNQRSEEEFLYRLLRGNANEVAPSKKYRLKTYGPGYIDEGPGIMLDLTASKLIDYHSSFDQFVQRCNVGDLIAAARSELLSIISCFDQILPDAISDLPRDEQIAVSRRLLNNTAYADFWRQL